MPAAAVRRAAMFSRRPPPGRGRGADRRGGGAGRVRPGGRPAAAADARLQRPGRGRGRCAKAATDGGPLAVDCKLDGIRIQVHKDGERGAGVHPQPGGDRRPRARGRRGGRAPSPPAPGARRRGPRARRGGPAAALPGDGGSHGLPARRRDAAHPGAALAYFFDLLHVDGETLLDLPARERLGTAGRAWCPRSCWSRAAGHRRPGRRPRSASHDLVARGHEGVVVKRLDAPYEAGRRGAAWVKVKPRHTLDLVVLAVEWGSGRRTRPAVQHPPRGAGPATAEASPCSARRSRG